MRAAPLIVVGADKQRSLRREAALIITSSASVSLTLMIHPFLSSWRSGRSGPLTRTSPGSVSADGAVGSRALDAPSASGRTNASFRTKSQSFLHGPRKSSEWPVYLAWVRDNNRIFSMAAHETILAKT